jgi:putative CocE/NonD family hydrolase
MAQEVSSPGSIWNGPPPRPATYEARMLFDLRIPMRDGVTLSADITRPAPEGRYPALVVRTPYNKNTITPARRYFAERGYVYVVVDVRGRGDSDGAFVPYRHDALDGYDVIEWVAAQPWCDGNVGTTGGSYLGRIQWLTALTHPPHLRAMCALVSPSDPFVEWPMGTAGGPMHLAWIHLVSGRLLQPATAVDWSAVYKHLPLLTMDEAAGRISPFWRDDVSHPIRDAYWEAICYQDKFDQIDVPVLHISGWYDDEQIGTPLNFAGMTAHGATAHTRANQKLLMGPWSHAVNAHSKLGEVDFGSSAIIDLDGYQLRWFDHWLRGADTGLLDEPPVRLFLMGANRWRDASAWPPPDAQPTPFYLHSGGHANSRFGDGGLSPEPPEDEPPDGYHYDPARPVPFITEPTSAQIGGPDDYAAIERRDDVLVYTSAPLDADLTVIGPVRMELYAASSAPDTDFMVKLLDVHPSGFAQRLCDSMVRARYRAGFTDPQPIPPGEVVHYTIDLWNTAHVFLQGHCLRLEVASSAFPKYDRHRNRMDDLATGTEMDPADQHVWHTAAHPSHVVIPVVAGETN